MGPGFNWGSGGGARGCSFEERVGAYIELELTQPHMEQKPVLRGEVGCACVAREVSVERGGMAYARTERGHFLLPTRPVCCRHNNGSWSFQIEIKHTPSRSIFKHAQHTHADPALPLGDTPNARVPPQTLALRY